MQATHLATSIKKIGMEFQSVSLSAGRLVIHSTPGTTTRDASVTSLVQGKMTVQWQRKKKIQNREVVVSHANIKNIMNNTSIAP